MQQVEHILKELKVLIYKHLLKKLLKKILQHLEEKLVLPAGLQE